MNRSARVINGRLVLGHIFEELQPLHWSSPDAKRTRRCARCGNDSPWRREGPKGWATHPHCEHSYFDLVTDELLAQIVFSIAQIIGVTGIREGQHEPPPQPPTADRRLGNPNAGCAVCGRPYAAPWYATQTWRCAQHPPGREFYRRR